MPRMLLFIAVILVASFWLVNSKAPPKEETLNHPSAAELHSGVMVEDDPSQAASNADLPLASKQTEMQATLERVVEVQTPRYGSVEVQVLDHLDVPIQGGFRVQLQIHHPSADPQVPGRVEPRPGALVDGICRFESVVFGARLEVTAHMPSGLIPAGAPLEMDGPTLDHPTTRISVRPYHGKRMFTGRVVNDRGIVGANRSFQFLTEFRHGTGTGSHGSTVKTDDQGRFLIPASYNFEEVDTVRLTIKMDGNAKHPPRAAKSRWYPDWGEEALDVGDLVLLPETMIASGKVINEAGKPVANANLRLKSRPHQGPPARVITDTQGNFEFFGEPTEADLFVDGFDGSHQFPKDATPAKIDMVIHVRSMVSVEVDLLLDDVIDNSALSLKLEPVEEEQESCSLWHRLNHPRWNGQLPRGWYYLIVQCKDSGEELYRGPQLLIEDEVSSPLATVDLTGMLSPITLTFRMADGSLPEHLALRHGESRPSFSAKNPIHLIRGPNAEALFVANYFPGKPFLDQYQDLGILMVSMEVVLD